MCTQGHLDKPYQQHCGLASSSCVSGHCFPPCQGFPTSYIMLLWIITIDVKNPTTNQSMNSHASYYSLLALFPGLPTFQLWLLAVWRKNAWYILSHEWCHCLPSVNRGGEGSLTERTHFTHAFFVLNQERYASCFVNVQNSSAWGRNYKIRPLAHSSSFFSKNVVQQDKARYTVTRQQSSTYVHISPFIGRDKVGKGSGK